MVSGAIWLMANVLCLATTDIWLTRQANGNRWPGSSKAPFYVRNAAALTSILVTNTPNCTFHYAAGTYQTYGYYWRQRSTANKGCKHFGAGVDKTIIQLVGAADGPAGVIFGADGDKLMDGFELHDMTLDCNAVHNARYTNHIAACTAVLMGGSDVLLDNLKIIGFGTGSTNVECFPVYVCPLDLTSTGATNIQNEIVQRCVFCSPAPSNYCAVSPLTVAAAPGFALSNCVARFCVVSNLAPYFPEAPHSFTAPLVENCVSESGGLGIYFEPGWLDEAHRDWIVRSNIFKNVDRALFVSFAAGRRIKSITFEGNLCLLQCPPSAGFYSWGPTPFQGEGIDWLVLRNNTVIQTNCVLPGTSGFVLQRASHVVVEGNQMILGPGMGLVLDSSTVTNVWFANNIDAARAPLLVTNWFLGTTNSQAAATRWQQVRPPAVNVRLKPGP